jgi:tRNA dimethylallyltransferase
MKHKQRNKVVVILGPTATGKSDLAVKLAQKYNGEVISADSRQVYTGLDLGTGKITKKEMLGVPHHMLDVVSPKKVFTVSEWKEQAEKIIIDIISRGKLPIICGGTGLYIQSIVDNVVFPEVPPNLPLRKKLEKKSKLELIEILKKLDPRRAKTK